MKVEAKGHTSIGYTCIYSYKDVSAMQYFVNQHDD